MTLSLTKVSKILLENDTRFKLIRYINQTQGFELARLDYDAAAEAIGVSYRTVGRLIKRLADEQIIVIARDKLRINEELRKAE